MGQSLCLLRRPRRCRLSLSQCLRLRLRQLRQMRLRLRQLRLCRRLGLGLILVRLADGHTQVVCDPAPYSPRINTKRKARLLREFARMDGDPNTGGSTRQNLMTAYRSDALRCQAYLQDNGRSRAIDVTKGAQVPTARRIMADNHYGWFERLRRGVYGLSQTGLPPQS